MDSRTGKSAVSVILFAAEKKIRWAQAISQLKKSGSVKNDDPRLGVIDDDVSGAVACSADVFEERLFRSLASGHDAIESLPTENGRPFRPVLTASRLMRTRLSYSAGADAAPLATAPLATASLTMVSLCASAEKMGVMLHDAPQFRKQARDILSMAAAGHDRAILSEQQSGFSGLVTPIALRNGHDFTQTAVALVLTGKIAPSDPRQNDSFSGKAGMRQLTGGEFLRSSLAFISKELKNARFHGLTQRDTVAMATLLKSLHKNFSALGEASNTLERDRAVRDINAGVSMNAERLALIVDGAVPGGQKSVSGLLATSSVATERSLSFSRAVARHEHEQKQEQKRDREAQKAQINIKEQNFKN